MDPIRIAMHRLPSTGYRPVVLLTEKQKSRGIPVQSAPLFPAFFVHPKASAHSGNDSRDNHNVEKNENTAADRHPDQRRLTIVGFAALF